MERSGIGRGTAPAHRAILTGLIFGLMISTVGAFSPPMVVPALALSCGPNVLHFAANDDLHVDVVRGASAKIEFINESLCTGPGISSFSSYWVAVTGLGSPKNIYQIGVDECHDGACPQGNPQNTPYYFWAYGRGTGGGCTEVSPQPVFIGNASSGTRTYTILKVYTPMGWYYQARMSGVTYDNKLAGLLDSCWSGVDTAQIANEVLNVNDQSGGPNSNRQNFEEPLWHDGVSWKAITRPGGSNCDFIHQPANQRCQWAADGSAKWWSWDTRWP